MNKLKAFLAVATRYDERERIYQGTVDVASIRIWLSDRFHDQGELAVSVRYGP